MKKRIAILLFVLLAACGRGGSAPDAGSEDRFAVISAAEMPLAGSAQDACVRDSQTGLVWEVKADATGLHDWRNTYSWFTPEQSNDGMDYRGTTNGGQCRGSACDTWGIVIAVNEEAYCGYSDWRIPLRDELFSISDLRKADNPPTIDVQEFPQSQAAEYWSANDYSFRADSAWAWNFQYGHDRVDWKKSPKFVRLVRGTASGLTAVKE